MSIFDIHAGIYGSKKAPEEEKVYPFPKKTSYWYVAQTLRVFPEKKAIPEDIAMTIGWTREHTRRVLKEMAGHGLVKKVDEEYKLTTIGEDISEMTLRKFKADPMYAWCHYCMASKEIVEIRFYEDGVSGKLACGHHFDFGWAMGSSKGINPRWVLEIFPDEVAGWTGMIDRLLTEHAPRLTRKEESFLRSLRYYIETERKITIPQIAWLHSICERIGVIPPKVPLPEVK